MKRKILLKALGGLSIACLAGAFAFFPANSVETKAETEETPVAVENVAMAYGAAVRISSESSQGNYAGKSGLRFTMYIDKDTYNTAVATYGADKVEVGMYYVGKNIKVGETVDETTDTEMQNIDTIPASARHAVMEAYIDASAKTVEPSYAFNVAQLDIPESGYNVQLIANGYIKTIDSEGKESYIWATNPQTRSVAQVASIGLSKGNTHSDLHNFVNAVATEDTFKFETTAFDTDMYKQAELNVNATVPAHLQVVWESDNEEVATVDETGKITKVGKGTANVTAKIGNNVRTASVTIGDPIALKVQSEADADMIAASNGVKYQYVASDSEELSGFTGGYSGNALKHDAGGNGLHNLYSAYTEEELAEIAKDYNKVTFWFAIAGGQDKADSNGFIRHYKNEATVETLALGLTGNKDYKIADGGTWAKWSLSINDYISLLTEEVKEEVATGKSFVSLYQAWAYNFAVNPYMYLGDVEFVLDPYIVKVGEGAESQITKGSINGTYVANVEGSAIDGFTGEYEGDAISFLDARSKDYRVANPYTLESLESLKTKYSKVSMWIAMDNIGTTGYFMMHSNPSSGARQCFLNKVYSNDKNAITSFTNATNNKWFKYSVSIDDYISLITTTTGAGTENETVTVHDYFIIANPNVSGSTTSITDVNGDGDYNYEDVTLYVGDIFFE